MYEVGIIFIKKNNKKDQKVLYQIHDVEFYSLKLHCCCSTLSKRKTSSGRFNLKMFLPGTPEMY